MIFYMLLFKILYIQPTSVSLVHISQPRPTAFKVEKNRAVVRSLHPLITAMDVRLIWGGMFFLQWGGCVVNFFDAKHEMGAQV